MWCGFEYGCRDNSLGDFDPLGEQSTLVHHREACSAFKDHREGSYNHLRLCRQERHYQLLLSKWQKDLISAIWKLIALLNSHEKVTIIGATMRKVTGRVITNVVTEDKVVQWK